VKLSSSLRSAAAALGLGLASLALGGCGPDFDRVSIDGIVGTNNGSRVDVARVVVPEGMVVKAHIVAYNDDNEPMGTRVETRNGRVLGTSYVISDHDFAFYGIGAGETDVDVYADGKLVLVMHATVTPQPGL